MRQFKGLLLSILLPVAALRGAVDLPSALRQARLDIDQGKFADALALLTDAKKSNPADPRLTYLRGYVLYRLHEPKAARLDLKTSIDLAPPGLQSRYILGRMAESEGQKADAIRWLVPCAEAAPPVEDSPARLSKLYWETGQTQLARTWTEKAVAAAPWDGALHYRLGRIFQQIGDPESARTEFGLCVKSKSADSEGVRKLMECSQALSSHDAATAFSIRDEFLKGPPLDPDLLVALGTTFATAGSPDQAVELFKEAATRDPEFFQAQFNLGLALLNLKEPEAAVEPLAASARMAPESKQANAALGLAYVMQGRFKEAVAPLEAAHQSDPDDSKAAGLLSVAYYRSGTADKAVPILRQSIQKSRDDPKFYFLLIDCLNAAEKQQEALEISSQAVQRFPQLAKAWLSKGQQLARLGEYHEAGPFFAKAVALAPDQVDPLLGLGDAELKDGAYEAALDSYRRARAKDNDVSAVLGAARSLVFLGRIAEARNLLEAIG